jgi:MFS family permease
VSCLPLLYLDLTHELFYRSRRVQLLDSDRRRSLRARLPCCWRPCASRRRLVSWYYPLSISSAALTPLSRLDHRRADRYGRRRLCLVFTATYTLSCATKMIRPLPSLVLGRLLGGLSTSILFSVFESWLVSSALERGMEQGELNAFLGRLTLVNGAVACGAGVLSNQLVEASGTFKSPFIASAGFLVVAGLVISARWNENYGETKVRIAGRWEHLLEAVKVVQNGTPGCDKLETNALTSSTSQITLYSTYWLP